MIDPLQNQLPIRPDHLMEILIRRKWFILIPLCITLTAGLFHTLTAPKTYEASTLILVQPQRVPTNYVRSVVTSTISQRISTISQQILSRSNLEKIIDQFGLFENAQGMYLEDKVASMRKRVQVKIERSRSGSEAFSIVFKGSEPQRVMRIANTLASYFMDENLKVREAQAVGTSEFLDSELEKTRKRLEEREKQLSEYKEKHFGGLPSELQTNLRMLDRLQEEISGKNLLLRQAKESLSVLESQIQQAKQIAIQTFDDNIGPVDLEEQDTMFEQSENEKKLAISQKQLETLQLSYTEKHPDVAKLIKKIEKLETAIEEEKKANEEENKAEGDIAPQKDNLELGGASDLQNFTAMQQKMQLDQIKNEIKQIKSDISKLEDRKIIYQKRVEDTPKRELEMQSLKRDYSNIKGVFDSLLDRKLEAELSVNMEKKQKGEQFRILDHARMPEKPISPNVKMLFLLSIASGVGFGIGLIFLLEFFDTSIRREEQIETELGLKILAAVPPLKKAHHKIRKKFSWIIFISLSGYALFCLSFFAILNYKGLDRTLNFIKTTLNI